MAKKASSYEKRAKLLVCIIKKGEEQLEFFEEKLGLAEHYKDLETAVERLREAKQALASKSDTELKVLAETISEVIATILNKGS